MEKNVRTKARPTLWHASRKLLMRMPPSIVAGELADESGGQDQKEDDREETMDEEIEMEPCNTPESTTL